MTNGLNVSVPHMTYRVVLHFKNIRASKFLSFKRHLSALKTFPAIENSLSTGAEEAGSAKYVTAILLRVGNFFALDCQ